MDTKQKNKFSPISGNDKNEPDVKLDDNYENIAGQNTRPEPAVSGLTRIIVITIIISVLAGFAGGFLSFGILTRQMPASFSNILSNSANSGNVSQTVTPQEMAVETVVKNVAPSVVSVIATANLSSGQYSNPLDQFFGNLFPQLNPPSSPSQNSQPQEIGGGSGFIISGDGMILTNKHVVDIQGASYTVLTNDGQKYPAQIIAQDPVQDIAILKINKNNLPVVKLGDSANLEIGQSAIAIGNALGEFRNTVSVGVISGLGRSVTASNDLLGTQTEQLEGVIQTDAAINPGNSGGPLLNLSGEVIGINVAVAQGAQNIGFALPINLAKRDIAQVKNQGKISYPFLGVRYVIITPEIKTEKNLSVDYGALILRGTGANEPAITPGSPAAKAGLQENDIILEADRTKIDTNNTLAKIIQNHNVGDKITLKILHSGQEKTITVTLGEK
jgi:S1-C subfamily serine protease